jgi:N-acylneuraminate cytidylyltransferase
MSALLKSEFPEPYNMPRQSLPDSYWQTGHVEAIRYETITKKHSMTGSRILPLVIDNRYAVDIDNQEQWEMAEWMIARGNLEIARPGLATTLPDDIRLVVLDFDGVLTDNRVFVLEDGREAVRCSRSDGMGVERLKQRGIKVIVLSKETNPVVTARCNKLGITCYQGIGDKAALFETLVFEQGATLDQVIYVGNDVNDLDCMRLSHSGVAVADAHPDILRAADWVLSKPGGDGAVRELSDLIIARIENRRTS